jgi:hypothetical protein
MFKKTLLVLVALLVVLLIVILNQPDDFSLSRSTAIAAPPATVHAHVNDFRKWEAWSPWAKLDPNSTAIFEGAESGKGAIFKWSGNNEVGEGKQEIVESKPGELVRIKIDFTKPFEGSNDVEFSFMPEGSGTLITWSMSGKNNFIGKCISLIMDCETMVGPMFEQGLANLKSVAESAPQTAPPNPSPSNP